MIGLDAPATGWQDLVFLAVLIALVVIGIRLIGAKMDSEVEDERRQVFRNAIEQKREEIVQMLIDASPGGRKSWQYDPCVPTLDDLRRELEERKSLARQKSGEPGE